MRLRRVVAVAAAAATALAAGGAAKPPAADAASATTTSTNWAGYAVSRSGVRFRRVSAAWTQPAITCTPGTPTFSAVWVGLGGYRTSAQALEQIGTEADCNAVGKARYSTRYELVPAAAVDARLTSRPGDQMSASVTVSGHQVKLRLADRTRGTVFTRTVRAATVDVTSAEWIVEAPSLCNNSGNCSATPLTNFGTTGLSEAKATTAVGHSGTISDPAWASIAINLVSSGRRFIDSRAKPPTGSGAAITGALSATGDGFGVAFQEDTSPASGPSGPPGFATVRHPSRAAG